MPRVVVVRGHLATPWELRPWEELRGFDVAFLHTRRNAYDVSGLELAAVPVRALRDLVPAGRAGDALATAAGDRYLGLKRRLAGADVVHAEELSYWFAAEAARAKRRCGFKLVQTVWETIPFLSTYRNRHARRFRRRVLAGTDLFLAATERARDGLLLEGVPADRIEVCPPGIDVDRFARAAGEAPEEHVVLSPGRLVWEKGHQDVMRAVAALQRGLVRAPAVPRLLVVGSGPEEARLRAYADELGIGPLVTFRSVGYDEMPAVFARASAMVLASLPAARAGFHVLDIPRVFWEEQFGLVLAEAMASGLAIVAAASGAIPEVVGDDADLVLPGDWMGIARALAGGPLARPPGERVAHDPERVRRYSTAAAAERLARAYERVLSSA